MMMLMGKLRVWDSVDLVERELARKEREMYFEEWA